MRQLKMDHNYIILHFKKEANEIVPSIVHWKSWPREAENATTLPRYTTQTLSNVEKTRSSDFSFLTDSFDEPNSPKLREFVHILDPFP